MIGSLVTYWISFEDRSNATEHAQRRDLLEIARIKIQVFETVNSYHQAKADFLVDEVLKPILSPSDFERFLQRYRGEVANVAVAASEEDSLQYSDASNHGETALAEDLIGLVRMFSGEERLIASNRLVELYPARKTEVVRALIEGLVDEDARPNDAYRINLYVAFTLGRLVPEWKASTAQIDRISQLRSSRFYRDATFKRRVDQALERATPMDP